MKYPSIKGDIVAVEPSSFLPNLFVLATIRETTAEIIFSSIPHFDVNTIIDITLFNLIKSTFFVFFLISFISFNNFFKSSFRNF